MRRKKIKDAAIQGTEADFTDFAHTGPGTLAGRYMRLFWHPVFIAEDLKPGQAKPVKVMSEDFVVYRGENGRPQVCEARCPHRGALLHTGYIEGDCIRCFYHGWKFNPSGACVDMPCEEPNFRTKVKIRSYPTEEYLGLIFAYLGEGDAPPLPRYPEMEGDGVLDVGYYIRLCNYFNNVENNVDPAHTPYTHRASNYTKQGLGAVTEVTGFESEWGITQQTRRGAESMRMSQHGQPTMLNLKFQPTDEESGWKELMAWRVPIDDSHHISYLVNYVQVTGEKAERYRQRMAERKAKLAALEPGHLIAQRVLSGELEVKDILSRPDYLEIQDHIAQCSQGIIADRNKERLGRTDVLIILMRKIWERELRALAEGRPLKQWHRPPSMHTTTGIEHKQRAPAAVD